MLLPPDHDPLTACATDAPSVTHLDDRQRILAAVRAVAATPAVVTHLPCRQVSHARDLARV